MDLGRYEIKVIEILGEHTPHQIFVKALSLLERMTNAERNFILNIFYHLVEYSSDSQIRVDTSDTLEFLELLDGWIWTISLIKDMKDNRWRKVSFIK